MCLIYSIYRPGYFQFKNKMLLQNIFILSFINFCSADLLTKNRLWKNQVTPNLQKIQLRKMIADTTRHFIAPKIFARPNYLIPKVLSRKQMLRNKFLRKICLMTSGKLEYCGKCRSRRNLSRINYRTR